MTINMSLESKIKKKRFSVLLTYTFSVLSLLSFLYGFFPFKYSSKSEIINSQYLSEFGRKRYIDKLAFVVIDALRYDFVVPENGQEYMPFTLSSIVNQESCYLVTKAHSPTVTLPRLKAITSGSISTYVDVVLNFMTPAFEEDNFITSAFSNGLKIVFYGDDTWLKLFPNSFTRSDGTNSFFTYDYYEVDNNVTRHIDEELSRNDWDIIILHYLGLDHIGHTEGPNSPLVKPKLIEMDDVVKKFNDAFKKMEMSQGLRTMLLVTGDHGMKDSGSHGGVTYPEVMVPLVSVGHSCAGMPGWPNDHTPLQIDIAPTLSAVFGLPIPDSNMGKIIPGLLYNMPRKEVLQHLEMNRLQLDRLAASSIEDSEGNSLKDELNWFLMTNHENEGAVKNITNKYFQRLDKTSAGLVLSNSDFKFIFLLSGVITLWTLTVLLLYEFAKRCPKPRRCLHWFLIVGTTLHALSLVSSSFIEEEHQTWYFLWATFCVLVFLEALSFRHFSALVKAKFLISWIVLAVIHRVLRKLNQTGDKWAFLPDIKSYLHSEEGQFWLLIVFLCGLVMTFACAFVEKCSPAQLTTYCVSLLTVFLYRVTTGNFKFHRFFVYPHSRGLTEVFIFWIFLSVFAVQTVWNKTPSYLLWILFSSLLQRPHNVILLPAQVFFSKQLHELFRQSEDAVWNGVAHVWLGNVFYFYQGNGNSLSNVDVAAGFVGVETYDPLHAGLMIAANTFSSHVLSFILSPKTNVVFATLRVLPLAWYSTVLMFLLNHLFIWSVFSPKLLFEASVTLLLLFLMWITEFLEMIAF